jgi:hypothetical protein
VNHSECDKPVSKKYDSRDGRESEGPAAERPPIDSDVQANLREIMTRTRSRLRDSNS